MPFLKDFIFAIFRGEKTAYILLLKKATNFFLCEDSLIVRKVHLQVDSLFIKTPNKIYPETNIFRLFCTLYLVNCLTPQYISTMKLTLS